MAKIFLDANIFIDIIEKRGNITAADLAGHELFVSPLSIHILHYVTKQNVPYEKLLRIIELFTQVQFDQKISVPALIGPTNDFEDNVQLHSAVEAQCHYFLTEDKELLSLKFFGKMRITNRLATS